MKRPCRCRLCGPSSQEFPSIMMGRFHVHNEHGKRWGEAKKYLVIAPPQSRVNIVPRRRRVAWRKGKRPKHIHPSRIDGTGRIRSKGGAD